MHKRIGKGKETAGLMYSTVQTGQGIEKREAQKKGKWSVRSGSSSVDLTIVKVRVKMDNEKGVSSASLFIHGLSRLYRHEFVKKKM